MSTPRPTIKTDCDEYNYTLMKVRLAKLRQHIHSSHENRRVFRLMRELQIQKFIECNKVTKKRAREMLEDPNPYEKDYLFYCVK